MKSIFSAEWVAQDRFHVMHNISPDFNNQDPRFFELVILNFRNLTTRRDPNTMEEVELRLRQGRIAKKVTFGHATFEVKLGQEMTQEEIEHWKAIGVFHEMFSTSPSSTTLLQVGGLAVPPARAARTAARRDRVLTCR